MNHTKFAAMRLSVDALTILETKPDATKEDLVSMLRVRFQPLLTEFPKADPQLVLLGALMFAMNEYIDGRVYSRRGRRRAC